jgi:CRISPR-associated protein Cas1
VLVLSGYGLRVAIERGQLIVADGVGRARRADAFSRATCGLKRLVLLGHSGTISFEALRWLRDVGAAVVQIDVDGNVIVASAPQGSDDARLRRAQALAAYTGIGLAITRGLLHDKLHGQAQVLARIPDTDTRPAQACIQQALQQLARADTFDQMRLLEAQAAAGYWSAWSGIELHFATRDAARVPEHWRTFGTRRSPVSGASRNAANPANALLNYLYAILEAEAAIAARAVGLDPGMGLLHADQRNRDSLACDLMEAIRPQVDAIVLELLCTHTFSVRDFFENRQGVCRLLPPLTQLLAESAPQWAKAIAPIAERVAQRLAQSATPIPAMNDTPEQDMLRSVTAKSPASAAAKRTKPLATPLTQTNRSRGREGLRRRPAQSSSADAGKRLPHACLQCGTLLPTPERQYCDACLPERRAELLPMFSQSGPTALATRRAQQVDPAHGGAAGFKRSKRTTQHWQELSAWRGEDTGEGKEGGREAGEPADHEFALAILPKLAAVRLVDLMQATGLSRRYCWLIKTGQKVPHKRHWAVLNSLRD